jgi:hypothetical protein
MDAGGARAGTARWRGASRLERHRTPRTSRHRGHQGAGCGTLYGTEASNGVIQIITKRGKSGRRSSRSHAPGNELAREPARDAPGCCTDPGLTGRSSASQPLQARGRGRQRPRSSERQERGISGSR